MRLSAKTSTNATHENSVPRTPDTNSPPDDPKLLEAVANEYMHKQSLDFYSNVYGFQLSKDPVDVPRQEQSEFDDDYFTSVEKAKYEYPKPMPQPGECQGLPFKWQQGGLLGRGSFGCVC